MLGSVEPESKGMSRTAALVLLAVAACNPWLIGCAEKKPDEPEACTPDAAVALYARKIEPILKDDHPASCTQCHLSGIDLSLFVKDTPCQTMACMEQLGLVDLSDPDASKVLSWIGRAKPDSNLITADVVAKEQQGFREWIEYSARCGAEACPKFDDPCGTSQDGGVSKCDVGLAVGGNYVDPGDCQELTLEQLFAADVYRWRERCYPCHFTSDQSVMSAPKWIWDANMGKTSPELSCAAGSLETMRSVLWKGLVDLEEPTRSLILRKPLSSANGGVEHGGGEKFGNTMDPSYLTFLDWITRYAACSARDPTLTKAAPAPTVGAEQPDAGSPYSIYGYCNCLILNCHDAAHARWGPLDEEVLAGCRAEAIGLPSSGSPTTSGNSLECRAGFCELGKLQPDACSAAMGDSVCR
jgi:hypothetical protein